MSDPIVAEVRRNREAMLAEFDGDTKKLTAHLESKRQEMESAGYRFETAEKRKKRLARSRKQREAEIKRVALLTQ
jgi:hypothetical protein